MVTTPLPKFRRVRRFFTRTLPGLLHKDNANTVLSLLALAVSVATLYLTYFDVERELLVRPDSLRVVNESVRIRFVFLNLGNRPVVVLGSVLEDDYPLPEPLRDPNNVNFNPFDFGPKTTAPYELKDAVISANGVSGAEAGVWVYPKEAYESGTEVPGSTTGERRGIPHYLRLRVMDDQGVTYESRHFVGEIGIRPANDSDSKEPGGTLILRSGPFKREWTHVSSGYARLYARTFPVLRNTIEDGPPPDWRGKEKTQQPK